MTNKHSIDIPTELPDLATLELMWAHRVILDRFKSIEKNAKKMRNEVASIADYADPAMRKEIIDGCDRILAILQGINDTVRRTSLQN